MSMLNLYLVTSSLLSSLTSPWKPHSFSPYSFAHIKSIKKLYISRSLSTPQTGMVCVRNHNKKIEFIFKRFRSQKSKEFEDLKRPKLSIVPIFSFIKCICNHCSIIISIPNCMAQIQSSPTTLYDYKTLLNQQRSILKSQYARNTTWYVVGLVSF